MAPAFCTPADQCCCGFSLRSGAVCILLVNAVIEAVFFVVAFMSVFYPENALASMTSASMEVFTVAFCVAGLPFLVSGAVGIYIKDEIPLRIYYFYLVLAVAIAAGFVIDVAFTSTCSSLPADLGDNSAFFCGALQVICTVLVVTTLANLVYILYIVWSLCQDFTLVGAGRLHDLEASYGSIQAKKLHEVSHYLIKSHDDEGEGATFSGSGSTGGFGQGQKLFGYKHELQFPPTQASLPKDSDKYF